MVRSKAVHLASRIRSDNLPGDAHTVSAFYTASLAHTIGASYKAPNLAFLGKVYLQATGRSSSFQKRSLLGLTVTCAVPEVRHAAKLRFEAGIARLLDDQIAQLVECWKSHCKGRVPCSVNSV